MSSIDNKALSEAAKNLDTAVEMLLEYNIELEALRAENRRLKIEIAVLTNTPTGQDIVAAYKRAEAENERLREALDLLFRITCTNGADPDDVKPPVGRANWSSADRERALRLAKEALEVRE